MPVSTAEILEASSQLTVSGVVRAYRLSPFNSPEELTSLPPCTQWHDSYFLITESGREIQLSDQANWPFGLDGTVREGWKMPIG